jgi:biopolymer transport protein ExbD
MMSLLIIFMVVTPVLTGFGAMLPTARHAIAQPLEDVVTLGISEKGFAVIGEDTVPPERLGEKLREVYEQRPGDHLLYLWADRSMSYALVLDVIDAARTAGVRTVGAVVEPLDQPVDSTAPSAARR